MPVTFKIHGSQSTKKQPDPQATISLEISQTLDGNLLINDHQYIDIVVMPKESKIVAIPKPYAERDVYDYQHALMYTLFKGGVITGPIQGGVTFGMVEASYPSTANVDPVQAVLYQISEFIKNTAHDEIRAEEYEENIEDNFSDPPDDETTPYGKIPPYQDTAGANAIGDPTYTFAGYGYLY
jgi:hypothetical protein